MVNKNIQMKKKVNDSWVNLFPLTLTENVFTTDGDPLNIKMNNDKEELNEKIISNKEELNEKIISNKNDIEDIGYQVVWNEHMVENDDWTEAIQHALDHYDTILFPDKQLTITKPLHFTGHKKLIGKGVGKSVITKKGNQKLNTGLTYEHNKEGIIYYDDYDAILMTTGYTGEITIKDMEFLGDSDSPNEYGLLFPYTYRMNLNDIQVSHCIENIRFFMTWNTNLKKVRSRFSTYAFRVEGKDESINNPIQSTSIHFDNTFAEYTSFGYKLVNVTYFSGSAMSADFNDEVCYWFYFTSGSINGLGIEKSKGQFIRNWISNITVNGMFTLNNYQKLGLNEQAKSKGKFEVWSSNRNNTGLVIISAEDRNGLSGAGDSCLASVEGKSGLFIINSNLFTLTNSITKDNNIEKDSIYNIISNGVINLKGRYKSMIGDVDLNNELIGYNITDDNRNNVDGFIHINTSSDSSTNKIRIPTSEIQKRFPNFANSDSYLSMPIKINIVFGSGGASIIDNYIRNRTYIGDYQKQLDTTIKVTGIDTNSKETIISLSENISRYKVYMTLP